MQLTQMDSILIKMLYLSAAGIVVMTVLGVASVSSLLFGLTFILVVLLWCVGAVRKVTWTDAVLILTIGLALGHVIINASLEDAKISFAYFKKYIMFICTLVYFQAAYKLRVNRETEKFLLTLNSVLAVFLIAYFYLNQDAVYLLNGRVSGYLTFGFTNPNLTALFLMCIYTGEMVCLFRSKSSFGRIWHLLLPVAVCYLVWETESRNCLLTMAVETVLCVLLYLRKNGFRIPGWFSLLVTVWPLGFVIAYLGLVQNQQVQEWFSFMISEGKGLDTRVSIWMPALQYYAQSPIVGAYSQISRGTGMSQMHNTHLDILVSYGTVILVLVCYLLYKVIHSTNSTNNREDTMARLCFSGTIIMGMGEAALFSGGLGIYIFAGMFLLLCNNQDDPVGDRLLGGKRI